MRIKNICIFLNTDPKISCEGYLACENTDCQNG